MRDYYARFWCEVGKDLKIVTGKESVLSIIALLLAIPVGYFWGSIQPNQVHPYVMAALSVLGIIFILRLFFAMALAPVRLDRKQREKSERLESQIDELLAVPAVPQIEIERRALVATKLENFSEAEKDVLHFILQHGSAHWVWLSGKFGDIVAQDAIVKANGEGLLNRGSQECSIKLIFINALTDYFAKHRPVTPSSA